MPQILLRAHLVHEICHSLFYPILQLVECDLSREIGGCNSRTLRDRLADLEDVGVVSRHHIETMPPRVEYELTERGRELGDAFGPLAGWGMRHMGDEAPGD